MGGFPVFIDSIIGGFYFLLLLGCGGAFVWSLFVHKGPKRVITGILGAVCLVALLPLILLDIANYNTVSNASGTYTGNFGDGTDTLTLRSNGTFSQKFVSTKKRVYTSSGRWELHAKSFGSLDFDNPDTVDFDRLVVHADFTGQPQPPTIQKYTGADLERDDIALGAIDEISTPRYTR
jgi:hypothetical protein